MKKIFFSAIFAAAIPCIAAPKLSTGGARNGASFASATAANGGVAQGARFVLLGKDLGPAESASNEAYPLATELGGVSVKVTIGDTTLDAWVLSASGTKIVAMLPSTAPVGKGKVSLTYNSESTQGDIEVVSRAVGIFTGGTRGAGQAIALSVDSGAPLLVAASAKPGQQIRLRATGLGSVEGDEASAPTTKTFDTSDLEVRIADKIATIRAAQRTETAGIDEIVVEVPSGVDGCFAPVVVKNGSKYSNFVTIPVAANGGFCSSNLVSAGSLEGAAANGEVRSGTIGLSRFGINVQGAEIVTDSASGSFQKYKLEDYGGSGASSQSDFALGSCMVLNFDFVPDEGPEVPFAPPVDLAAGRLTVTGPKGEKSLGDIKGSFSVELGTGFNIALPPGVPSLPSTLFLEPGSYTVEGTGGADVGPFSVQVQMNLIEWTNPSVAAAVVRSQPLNLTWTGGGASDYVMALGTSFTRANSGTFVCIAKASDLKITVLPHILQNLPASVSEGSILGLFSISEPKSFKASGLDIGSLTFSRFFAREANFR